MGWPPTTHQDVQDSVTALLAAVPAPLTGAVASARFVGGTISGAPTTGTFAVGDYVNDHSGAVWICTTAGSPGTWVQAGSGSYIPSAGVLSSYIGTNETSVSSAYAALATAGPSVSTSFPASGRLMVCISVLCSATIAGAACAMGVDVGTSGASDTQACFVTSSAAGSAASPSRQDVYTGVAGAAVTITAKYRVTAGATGNWQGRSLIVIPI